jgi:integrase
MLSPQLLAILQNYWWVARPSSRARSPLANHDTSAPQGRGCDTAEAVGIKKHVSPHQVRLKRVKRRCLAPGAVATI